MIKRYNIQTTPNQQNMRFEDYLKLARGKYLRARNLVQVFYPDGHFGLEDLHSEYNAVAWEGYIKNLPVRPFLRLVDRRFYWLLTRIYGIIRKKDDSNRLIWTSGTVSFEVLEKEE